MENPITIIKKDHKIVEGLFKEYEALGDRAYEAKSKLSDKIIDELMRHAKMEEKLYYPRLKDAFNKEGDKLVEEAEAEHHAAKVTMAEIKMLSSDNPQFEAKMTVLREMIEHHVKEEEEEMLPKSEKELSKEQLEEIGKEMMEFKEDADKSIVEKILS